MYVPDETVFTKGTLRRFKIDFKEVILETNICKGLLKIPL